jgi:hypothetical protein
VSTRASLSGAAALALALLAAPAAHAATATINGTPLSITASDIGSIQISSNGVGQFAPQPTEPAYAGFSAVLRRPTETTSAGFGYTAGGGFRFTPASPAPTVTGDGGATSPFVLTATFDAIGGGGRLYAHVTEQIVYLNGSPTVEVAYGIDNTDTTGSALTGRFFESADLAVGGNSSGIGTFTATPIRQVGGVNQAGTAAATIFETSPWTHYQEDSLSTVQNIVNSTAATLPNLADTINTNLVDNAVAVQWDVPSLGPGETTGEGVVWNFGPATGSPPPVPGKAANVSVVSGKVLVKLPGNGGFVPLTGQQQIPVGSQVDTTKGRVKLTSAANTAGKTQASQFYDGVFQIKQSAPTSKSAKPTALTTDIVLKGELPRSACAPLKGASAATVDKKKGPKGVLGKLWGSGKGKFRTSGKYSSATVRGTIWLTQDECDGTLVKVKRGVVAVRDLRRHKTVNVKAGHSYLARAPR